MTTIPKSVPHLDFTTIAKVESDFLIAFPYKHSEMDRQVMLNHLISFSFSEKVLWLACRPNIVDLALKHARDSRRARILLDL